MLLPYSKTPPNSPTHPPRKCNLIRSPFSVRFLAVLLIAAVLVHGTIRAMRVWKMSYAEVTELDPTLVHDGNNLDVFKKQGNDPLQIQEPPDSGPANQLPLLNQLEESRHSSSSQRHKDDSSSQATHPDSLTFHTASLSPALERKPEECARECTRATATGDEVGDGADGLETELMRREWEDGKSLRRVLEFAYGEKVNPSHSYPRDWPFLHLQKPYPSTNNFESILSLRLSLLHASQRAPSESTADYVHLSLLSSTLESCFSCPTPKSTVTNRAPLVREVGKELSAMIRQFKGRRTYPSILTTAMEIMDPNSGFAIGMGKEAFTMLKEEAVLVGTARPRWLEERGKEGMDSFVMVPEAVGLIVQETRNWGSEGEGLRHWQASQRRNLLVSFDDTTPPSAENGGPASAYYSSLLASIKTIPSSMTPQIYISASPTTPLPHLFTPFSKSTLCLLSPASHRTHLPLAILLGCIPVLTTPSPMRSCIRYLSENDPNWAPLPSVLIDTKRNTSARGVVEFLESIPGVTVRRLQEDISEVALQFQWGLPEGVGEMGERETAAQEREEFVSGEEDAFRILLRELGSRKGGFKRLIELPQKERKALQARDREGEREVGIIGHAAVKDEFIAHHPFVPASKNAKLALGDSMDATRRWALEVGVQVRRLRKHELMAGRRRGKGNKHLSG